MSSWTTLKGAIALRGMKVYEFAEAVGVGRQTAYNWVNQQKRPKATRIPKIAEVLTSSPVEAAKLRDQLLKEIAGV